MLISAVMLPLTFSPELTQEMVLPKQYHPLALVIACSILNTNSYYCITGNIKEEIERFSLIDIMETSWPTKKELIISCVEEHCWGYLLMALPYYHYRLQ